MKVNTTAVSTRSDSPECQRIEALVTRHLCDLFIRLPALSGFHLRPDLTIAELAVFGWPDISPLRSVDDIVMQSLLELAECQPEAVLHMRGRTFVRSLH
jgi:hypothetical protein